LQRDRLGAFRRFDFLFGDVSADEELVQLLLLHFGNLSQQFAIELLVDGLKLIFIWNLNSISDQVSTLVSLTFFEFLLVQFYIFLHRYTLWLFFRLNLFRDDINLFLTSLESRDSLLRGIQFRGQLLLCLLHGFTDSIGLAELTDAFARNDF